jgi:hypothetical protein
MKVLVICENDQTISCLKTFFKAQDGYEVITYKFPLKALDNFGEISPNLVVYSAADFPRHWKIFLQYVNAIHISTIYDTVLIVDKKFDANEKEKSKTLGVWKLLSESKLHKYIASSAAGTVNFVDVITTAVVEDESEQALPVEVQTMDAVDEPETEDTAMDVVEEPEIEEPALDVVDEPEIEEPTMKVVEEAPVKTAASRQIIIEPIEGEDPFEQALREQETLLKAQMAKPEAAPSTQQSAAPAEQKIEDAAQKTEDAESDFSLSDSDIELLKSLAPEKVDPKEVQFLFRHPQTGALITGVVQTVTGNMVVFKPDNPSVIDTFAMGQYVSSASYKNGDSVSLVGAFVMPYDDTIHLTLDGAV